MPMRRALVLSTESARHPFRASLPMRAFALHEMENRRSWRLNFALDENGWVKDVAATYFAGFLATTVYFM